MRSPTSETKVVVGRGGRTVRSVPASSLLAGENLPSLSGRHHANSALKLLLKMKHWSAWIGRFGPKREADARFNRRRANTPTAPCGGRSNDRIDRYRPAECLISPDQRRMRGCDGYRRRSFVVVYRRKLALPMMTDRSMASEDQPSASNEIGGYSRFAAGRRPSRRRQRSTSVLKRSSSWTSVSSTKSAAATVMCWYVYLSQLAT